MRHQIGLLLGAGASVEAGMPLVWDLTNEIKNWLTPDKLRELNRGWRLQRSGYSDSVIEDLATLLERPDLHYEAIIGHLETQSLRQRGLQQEYHGLHFWMVELISILLMHRQGKNDAFFGQWLPMYDGLGKLAQGDNPLWIFSLNHDLIIEAVAARLELPIYCGFSSETINLPHCNRRGQKIGEIKAEVITGQDLEHGCMHFPNPPQPGIYLLKIHGSLDTFAFNDGKDLLRLLPQVPGPAGVFDALRAVNSDYFNVMEGETDRRVKAINEIIYLDDAGEMQFLRRSPLAGAYKFRNRASQTLPKSLLKHFQQNLNFVSELVAIGYSFGDTHINEAIRSWLEFSADRRLEIVNPNISEIPSALLHVAQQITLTNSACTDYLDARADIERTTTEKLKKKISAIIRKVGKARADQAMASFINDKKEERQQVLRTKLESLPIKNGEPDLSELGGDPAALARQWAEDMQESEDETLSQILDYLMKAEDA